MNTSSSKNQLTRFAPASLRELSTISLPLILSFLSVSLMIFSDRIILARYSTAAMNGMITAWMTGGLFWFSAMSVASISEVFVGQFNGRGEIEKTGSAAWQMVWFAALCTLLFWPLAFFATPLFVGHTQFAEHSTAYFKTTLLFGPLFPCYAALSGFFIGIGKTRIVLSNPCRFSDQRSARSRARLWYRRVDSFAWNPRGSVGDRNSSGCQLLPMLYLFPLPSPSEGVWNR